MDFAERRLHIAIQFVKEHPDRYVFKPIGQISSEQKRILFIGTDEEARKQAYSRIKNIILLNMYYRTDIGVRWYNDSDKLQTWGYLH